MRYILSLVIGCVLFSGCITKNYYCHCGTGCSCCQDTSPQGNNGPVVSPEKINASSDDENAPQMHKDKPWYVN